MHVTHRVEQLRHLLLPGLDNSRVRVARRCDAESPGQVETPVAVCIPHVDALGSLPHDGPRAVPFNERHVARLELSKQSQNSFASTHESWIYDLWLMIEA